MVSMPEIFASRSAFLTELVPGCTSTSGVVGDILNSGGGSRIGDTSR